MSVLKMVDVSNLQAGDSILLHNNRYVVEYAEQDGIAFDMQLHDSNGSKVRKCLPQGETVVLEI